MKKFKKHIMTMSAILLIILVSSVPVFAQKNQEEKTKAVFGDETFVSNLAFEKIFDKVVDYLKIQGETIETADKNIGQIITALDVSGSIWFIQTSKKIQITLIKQNEQNTLIRVWVTEQTHFGGATWTEAKINKEKSKNLAQSIKKFLESDVDTTQKQAESEKSAQAEIAVMLTNADVIQMAKQKLPDAIIIQKIKYSNCKFDTSPEALSVLNKSGVSEQVILAMMGNTAVSKKNPTSVSVFAQKDQAESEKAAKAETASTLANAQGNQEEKKTKFGIGFQSAFPSWGISGMVDISDKISIQGILGAFSVLKTYAGRGIYRFKKETYWNAYGYGMLGAWSYPGYKIGTGWSLEETTETVMGFGAGAGIEYDWRGLAPKLPPLFWNLEIGLGSVKFKEIDYNFSAFMFGAGVHYRF